MIKVSFAAGATSDQPRQGSILCPLSCPPSKTGGPLGQLVERWTGMVAHTVR